MKAHIKATGEELEVHLVDKQARYIGSDGVTYWEEDLDFGIENDNTPDYWTKLEHQYAGMAMQGLCANYTEFTKDNDGTLSNTGMIVENSRLIAHALVEKMKEERK